MVRLRPGATVRQAALASLLATVSWAGPISADRPGAGQGAGILDDAMCRVVLRGGLRGRDALTLHLGTRRGRITQAWATTPRDNLAHEVDTERLRVKGSRLVGRADVTVHHVLHRFDLDVTVEDGALSGTFDGAYGVTDTGAASGKLSGQVAERVDPPGPADVVLELGGALPGMTGAISAAELKASLRAGRLRDGTVASVTGREPPHWSGDVARMDLRFDGRRLHGSVDLDVKSGQFLWTGKGLYTLRIDAGVVGNAVTGSLQTFHDDEQVSGRGVSGSLQPRSGRAGKRGRQAWRIVLDKAVPGEETLVVHIDRDAGRFVRGTAVVPRTRRFHGGAHEVDVSGLTLRKDALGGKLVVRIDSKIWRRGDPRPVRCEVAVDATRSEDAWKGSYEARYVAPAAKGEVSGEARGWAGIARAEPASGPNAFTPGRDYPRWRGPHANGSGVDCGAAMVESLADARLVWKSEADLPDAWVWGASRSPDVSGGYSSPIVAGGRVYLMYYVPSGSHLAKMGQRPDAPNPDKYLIDADDVIICMDARTGRTLWKTTFAGKGLNYNKGGGSGPLMTPTVADGRVYGIGSAGHVYCVDAETGEEIWQTTVGAEADRFEQMRAKARRRSRMPDTTRDFCSSPLVVDGVVVCNDNQKGLIGLDAETGERVWGPVGDCIAKSGSPVPWQWKGRTYVLAAGKQGVCLDPAAGRVVWRAPELGAEGTLALSGQYMVTGTSRQGGKKDRDRGGLSAYRISLDGAQLLWDLGKGYSNHVTSPVIHHGYVYAFHHRATICVELKTGRIVGRQRFPGVRSCSSMVAADGRLLREHLYKQLYFYKADPDDFRQLGEIWRPVSHAQNTTASIADGRLFLRAADGILCYDLRKSPASEANVSRQ